MNEPGLRGKTGFSVCFIFTIFSSVSYKTLATRLYEIVEPSGRLQEFDFGAMKTGIFGGRRAHCSHSWTRAGREREREKMAMRNLSRRLKLIVEFRAHFLACHSASD